MAAEDHKLGSHLVDEEESYFVSMTDMMVGVIFIFIILLMAFALNFQAAAVERESLLRELQETHDVRARILENIQRTLENEGVFVTVDLDNGVLRLPERILFASGEDVLSDEGVTALQALARALVLVVPCYANDFARSRAARCPDADATYLESIAVEGHTDNIPVGSSRPYSDNWELSMLRAINTYRTLISQDGGLDQLENPAGQKLFSVSGYGEFRPISNNNSEEGRRGNRRIDLRFRMMPPVRESELQNDLDRIY